MATSSEEGHLTNRQIVLLSSTISSVKMKSIAFGYLGLPYEKLVSLSQSYREDYEGFNRDIIHNWMCRNPESDQTKIFAGLLYQAAREGSYVDPAKVQEILGIHDEGTAPKETGGATNPQDPSEEDFQSIGEIMREDYKETMKIEMAPWAKAYTVDIKDMYTEPTLEKIENKPTGPIHSNIRSYKDFFRVNQANVSGQGNRKLSKIPIKKVKKANQRPSMGTKKESVSSMRIKTEVKEKSKGDRVLLKAEPGFGKTTLSRKISWDWALLVFTTFSIVFFVSLKLVTPGDAIENIIIQQTPPFEGMNVTPTKLKKILDTFGHRCLLILDGFDELSSKSKPEILKIIKGQILFSCNIFLTSRPHTVAELEKHFPIKTISKGFNKKCADLMINKILTDKKQRREVRKFTTKHKFLGDSLPTSPILLVSICILAKHGEFDFSSKAVTSGDIYLQLMRSLYRKYCERKGIPYRERDFVEVLRRVGNLAFKCLQTGNYLLSHDEVQSIAGEDAFEYGFISGHEDHRLLGDPTADVFISFLHHTVEEFLGAFSFVFQIHEGIHFDTLLRFNRCSPMFLTNLNFLEFCLFTINYVVTLCRKATDIKKILSNFVLEKIDVSQLDMTNIAFIFPALSWSFATAHNPFVLTFLKDVFMQCSKVRFLILSAEDVLIGIVDGFHHCFPYLHCLHLTGFRYTSNDFDASPLPKLCEGSLNVVISIQNDLIFNKVMSHMAGLQRDICLFVIITGMESKIELSTFLRSEISRLQFVSYRLNNCRVISGVLNQMYPKLTHIRIQELFVTRHCLLALSNAKRSGRLPILRHVEFPYCQFTDNNNITSLFQSAWSTLTELNLSSCFLSKGDIDILSKHKATLPQLNSLQLYLGPYFKAIDGDRLPRKYANYSVVESEGDVTLIGVLSENLTRLWLHDVDELLYQDVVKYVNSTSLPRLTEFGISTWSNRDLVKNSKGPVIINKRVQMIWIYNWVQWFKFKYLRSLSFNRFIRTKPMLYLFSHTPVLINLQKLDISHSLGIAGTLSLILCHHFPSLDTLILSSCDLNSQDLHSLSQASLKGRLPELKYLDISENESLRTVYESFFSMTSKWEKLKCLVVDQIGEGPHIFNHSCDCLTNLEEIQLKISGEGVFHENSSSQWQNLTTMELVCSQQGFLETLTGIVHNVENDILPSLKTVCVKVNTVASLPNRDKNLYSLWGTLKEKLRPSICKQIIDCIEQLTRCSRDNRFPNFSEEGDEFDNLIESITSPITEPMSEEEMQFVHVSLRNWITHSFIASGFMAEVLPDLLDMKNRLPILKQRLRMCNVKLFVYLNCFKSGAQSEWNVYRMRSQGSDKNEAQG